MHYGIGENSSFLSDVPLHKQAEKEAVVKNGKSAKQPEVATWTHAFVCLTEKSQVFLPSLQERFELKYAALGKKKLTVKIKDKAYEDLYGILLKELSLLSTAGGIDLMHTGFGARSKTLKVIPVPYGYSSYTIKYLKDILQQAKCYVRPIQKDLPMVIPLDNQGNLSTSTNVNEVIVYSSYLYYFFESTIETFLISRSTGGYTCHILGVVSIFRLFVL